MVRPEAAIQPCAELATAADAPDLAIELDILGIALFGNHRRAAAPWLTMRGKRCRPRQALVGRQGRRNGWIGRPHRAMPDVAMRMTVTMTAASGGSLRACRQHQNRPHQDQPMHTHPFYLAPGAPWPGRLRDHRPDGTGRHARSSDSTYIMIADKHSTTPIQNIGEWWMRRQLRGGSAIFM